MELSKILQYQKLDMEIYKIENAFRNSPEVNAIVSLQNKYKDEQNNLKVLLKESQDILAGFSKFTERLDEMSITDQNAESFIEGLNSLETVTDYDKELSKVNENLNNLEREAAKVMRRMNELKSEILKSQNTIAAMGNKYKHLKGQHENKQKEMQQQALPTLKALKELKDGGALDEKLMKKYQDLRNARKMPAFVPYNDGNCGGCGMDVAVEVEKHLKSSGSYTECPNCRRIIYKI